MRLTARRLHSSPIHRIVFPHLARSCRSATPLITVGADGPPTGEKTRLVDFQCPVHRGTTDPQGLGDLSGAHTFGGQL